MDEIHHFGIFLRTYLARTLPDDTIKEIEQHYFGELSIRMAEHNILAEIHYIGVLLGAYTMKYDIYKQMLRDANQNAPVVHPRINFENFVNNISKHNNMGLEILLCNIIACLEKFPCYIKGLPTLALFFFQKGFKYKAIDLLFISRDTDASVSEVAGMDEDFVAAVCNKLADKT